MMRHMIAISLYAVLGYLVFGGLVLLIAVLIAAAWVQLQGGSHARHG